MSSTDKLKTRVTERVRTGVEGLDHVLNGGLPKNRIYLIEGYPGCGKTTLALEFLLEGQRHHEPGVYVTLSETKEELLDVANSHGWSLEGISLFELGSEEKVKIGEEYTVFHPADVELNEIMQKIYAYVDKTKPTRVVFDSLSEMRLLARDPLRYRRQILALKQFFIGRQCTVLLLDDCTSQPGDAQLQSITHGVIQLERQQTEYGTPRRKLRIAKIRGVQFLEGEHDFAILPGKVEVYPRIVQNTTLSSKLTTDQVYTEIKELNAILGGGIDRGSCTLLTGPAGCGKSSLASQFVYSALKRGEACSCFLFEESRETYLVRSKGLGSDLMPFVENGLLKMQMIDPAELSPGKFAHEIRNEVETRNIRMVVIDSLNGYLNAMPSERFLLIQLHELLTYLNHHGIMTFLSLAHQGMVGNTMSGPVDVSYLADTIILLRYFEAMGQVRQAIAVVKRRKGAHERTLREFRLTSKGIEVGQPLSDFQGILSGIPTYRGGSQPLMKGDVHSQS